MISGSVFIGLTMHVGVGNFWCWQAIEVVSLSGDTKATGFGTRVSLD